jgi:4-amino-4-deoxy-L-arabinose transferase-like glycosyltransferase
MMGSPDELTQALEAALALDEDELAYLSGLDLVSTWARSSATRRPSGAWMALATVVAGFAAWFLVGPMIGSAVDIALEIGMGSVLLNAAFAVVFSVGQALLEVIRNPALGQTQPFFALLALALLFWPRQLIFLKTQRSAHS